MTVIRPRSPNNDEPSRITDAAIHSHARLVWTGFALIGGVLFGATAGLLSVAGGVPIPLAVLAGGAPGGSTIPLVLALLRYVAGEAA